MRRKRSHNESQHDGDYDDNARDPEAGFRPHRRRVELDLDSSIASQCSVDDVPHLVSDNQHQQQLQQQPPLPTTTAANATPDGKNKQKSHQKKRKSHDGSRHATPKLYRHPHGNFPDFDRVGPNVADVGDARTPRMPDNWFRGLDCLDIGCGFGAFPIDIGAFSYSDQNYRDKLDAFNAALRYQPRKMDAIDIDSKLVRDAVRYAGIAHSRTERRDGPRFPISFATCLGPIVPTLAPLNAQAAPNAFPANLHFACQDFVKSEQSAEAVYDTITW